MESRASGRGGLTLIELMVAMALMTILTGTIIFIFSQAQMIYTQVDAKVQVYQYARQCLDTMERDLANVVRTADMDFFMDGTPKNGHYDPGEELNGGLGIDGTEERVLTPPPGSPPNSYHYAFTMRQPRPYNGLDGKTHFHDSIYFKTITQNSDGQTVAALVEYAMVDMDRERPKLQKRIWYVTGSDPVTKKVEINGSKTSTAPIKQDLCLYVTDCQFQIFAKNNRKGEDPADKFTPGTFYTAKDLCDAKVDPNTGYQPFPPFRNFWSAGANDYMVQCYYDPAHVNPVDMGHFEKVDNGLFHTDKDFPFAMLGPGDKVFIFGLPANSSLQPNDYTIKSVRNVPPGSTNLRVEFAERISTTSPTFPATVECAYRAGFLPPAVRVTLKIKDIKAKEVRTISRTFKVLASN